jgi:hypothetical protein
MRGEGVLVGIFLIEHEDLRVVFRAMQHIGMVAGLFSHFANGGSHGAFEFGLTSGFYRELSGKG